MVSINGIFDDIKVWTWTRKIILSFSENPHFHLYEAKIFVGNNKIL